MKTLVLDYKIPDIAKIRSQVLSVQIKSRILCGFHCMRNYDLSLIQNFVKYHQLLMKDYTWIMPIAKNLKNNLLEETPLCALNNILKRPTLTFPSDTKEGIQISAPYNEDNSLLEWAETLFNRSFNKSL